MKVTTDACLFGAWVAEHFKQNQTGPGNHQQINNVLEIGAGTGLLSLMLAQKSGFTIDTVEIDSMACEQAKENIQASSWRNQIQIVCGDARKLAGEKTYELVISNPPFFNNQLRSANKEINMARHDDTLSLAELLGIVSRKLSHGGRFAVLLSYDRADYFINLASEVSLYLLNRVNVRQSTNHAFFRSILCFGMESAMKTKTEEFIIKDGANYTGEFTILLKDYYLKM